MALHGFTGVPVFPIGFTTPVDTGFGSGIGVTGEITPYCVEWIPSFVNNVASVTGNYPAAACSAGSKVGGGFEIKNANLFVGDVFSFKASYNLNLDATVTDVSLLLAAGIPDQGTGSIAINGVWSYDAPGVNGYVADTFYLSEMSSLAGTAAETSLYVFLAVSNHSGTAFNAAGSMSLAVSNSRFGLEYRSGGY